MLQLIKVTIKIEFQQNKAPRTNVYLPVFKRKQQTRTLVNS